MSQNTGKKSGGQVRSAGLKRQPFFPFVKGVLRLFRKRVKIINLAGEIGGTSIILSNHVAMSGPLIHELYFPLLTVKWGAGEMLGNYKMRFDYMRNVFYMQKKGYGKARATFLATFVAMFSKAFYRGMRVIPTWHDARLMKTVVKSVDLLKEGTPILIFPEDSGDGYHDVLTGFLAGFVTLAETYYKKTGQRVPVYPVYYHKKANAMVIGEPRFVQDFAERGMTREQIAAEFCKIVNGLREKYFTDGGDAREKEGK